MTAQNVITGSARATKGASGTHPRDKHKIGAPVTETTYNDHRTQMGGTVGAKTNPFSSNATKEDLYIQWQPNVLTTLQSWTYHLRLTMMSPKDKTKAGQSGIQTLNSENGIVVAETGVTSKFNITQLETTHIVNWTPKGRAAYALTATMTITEPLGVSLLDYIVRGEKALGLKSRTETIYLLEISFPENDDLEVKASQTNEKEYHFSYAMVITDFTVAVDQGGAKYYLKLVEMGQIALRSSVQDLHGSIKISANTLGQFTTEFSKILNEESKLETQHSAKFPDTFSIGFDKTSEQMSQWVFGGLQVYSGAPKHKLSLEGDILTSEFHKGSSIIDILSVAIAATVEMQQLPTIDGGKAKETGEDKETKQDSPHAWFKIVPEVIITNNYDTKRKVYQKTFIYKIKLIMDERLATLSDAFFTDPEKQKQRVGQLGKFKLLTKKYMYMYTGQNTEVLNFDIKLNYIYWRMVATGGGMQSNPDTILSQDPSADISDSSGSVPNKDLTASSPEIAETSDGAKPAKSLTETNGTGLNSSVMPPKFGEFLSVPQADEEPIKRTYLESFSAENDQEQENWYAPKIQATSLPTDTVAGTTQVAGATPLRFGEVYADKTSGDFMNIELNIVGDPYWLGMSNINKQYANIGTNLAAAYDHGSNLFYFKLLMPQEHDETGDTIITDSFTISGLYCVTHVISSYVDGGFTQHLQAYRSLASNYNLIKGQLDSGKNVVVEKKPDKHNDATPSDQLNEDTIP